MSIAEQILASPFGVENENDALAAMAGVLDVNAVKAGLVRAMAGSDLGVPTWAVAVTQRQYAQANHPAVRAAIDTLSAAGINVSFAADGAHTVRFAVPGSPPPPPPLEKEVRDALNPVAANSSLDRVAYQDHFAGRETETVRWTVGISREALLWARGDGSDVYEELAAKLLEKQISVTPVAVPPGFQLQRPRRVR
jgi:hypothetical protein